MHRTFGRRRFTLPSAAAVPGSAGAAGAGEGASAATKVSVLAGVDAAAAFAAAFPLVADLGSSVASSLGSSLASSVVSDGSLFSRAFLSSFRPHSSSSTGEDICVRPEFSCQDISKKSQIQFSKPFNAHTSPSSHFWKGMMYFHVLLASSQTRARLTCTSCSNIRQASLWLHRGVRTSI